MKRTEQVKLNTLDTIPNIYTHFISRACLKIRRTLAYVVFRQLALKYAIAYSLCHVCLSSTCWSIHLHLTRKLYWNWTYFLVFSVCRY